MSDIPPYNYMGLSEQEISRFETSVTNLRHFYKLEFQDEQKRCLQTDGFTLFRDYIYIDTEHGIRLTKGNHQADILFPKVVCEVPGHKGHMRELRDFQPWGYLELKKEYGSVLIKRETFSEKILELVSPVELDFPEDKDFSKKFYVISNDREKTARNLDENFRKAISKLTHIDILIEIQNNKMIVGIKDRLDTAIVKEIADFLFEIISISA